MTLKTEEATSFEKQKLDTMEVSTLHVKPVSTNLVEDFLQFIGEDGAEEVVYHNCGLMYDMHGLVTSIAISRKLLDTVDLHDSPLDQVLKAAFIDNDYDMVSIDILFHERVVRDAFTEVMAEYTYHVENTMKGEPCDCEECQLEALNEEDQAEPEMDSVKEEDPEVGVRELNSLDELVKLAQELAEEVSKATQTKTTK